MNKGGLLVLVGSLLLIVGGLLPWISSDLYGPDWSPLGGIRAEHEGDHILMIFFGLILMLSELLSVGVARWWLRLTKVVVAALSATVVFRYILHILELAPVARFFAVTDTGFYVTLVGALLALIGCIWGAFPSFDTTGDSDYRSNGLTGP